MDDKRYSPPRAAAEPSGAAEATGVEAELERYRDRLRYFAAQKLRDWAQADDVAQETLRRTFEALRAGRLDNPSALQSFLFQTALHICQHLALSFGREAKALRRVGATETGESAVVDPLAALISDESREQVRAALERLDASDREVLELTYVESLKTAQIALQLELTEGNVRVRRHRALKRLAELLGVTTRTERGHKQ